MREVERESMQYERSSSSAAARQGSPQRSGSGRQLRCAGRGVRSVSAWVEKGSEIGAHILSGAVNGSARAERVVSGLEGARRAAECRCQRGSLLLLSEKGALRTPNWMLPACFVNHGTTW